MQTKSNIMIAVAVIAVGLVSFISGRISVMDSEAQVVPTKVETGVSSQVEQKGSPAVSNKVQSNPSVATDLTDAGASSSTNGANGQFVASKNGTRYFPVTCGSSKTIKPENAIYFQTVAEAEASGKTQSPQCKY